MEKWRCKGKGTVKATNDSTSSQHPELNCLKEKRKDKKWTFGGLLKRISKNETTGNSIIGETEKNHRAAPSIIQRAHPKVDESIYNNIQSKNKYADLSSYDININVNNEKNSIESFGKNRRSRIKARIQAKRDRYCGNSSSDEEIKVTSNSLIKIQSENSINYNNNNSSNNHNHNNNNNNNSNNNNNNDCNHHNYKNEMNKRSRTARTERYMKRIYRDDMNGSNEHDLMKTRMTTDISQLCKNRKKYLSDSLSPGLWTKNDVLKEPRYYQSYCSEQNLINVFPRRNIDVNDLTNKAYNDKYTWPQRRSKITNNWNKSPVLDVSNYPVDKVQPPLPPPRSSKSRLFATPRFSLQHSDIENEMERNKKLFLYNNDNSNNYNCNSLDRIRMPRNYPRNPSVVVQKVPANDKVHEDPIVPKIKQSRFSEADVTNEELERRRHSKNLEEALLELETIYNSLRLSDEDLLDRAEQRSMEEYRDRVATTAIEGSIKSSSDTSSSYELSWRHANFDRCHENDTRLKDDMAYRRMHQNDRPPSVDPSQSSLSRVSYLATSPSSGHREMDCFIDKPKSRRSTPDLIHDDVVFRSITHSNNTLKVLDPQPPFGIPLGPVTAAAESDYLHVEPKEMHLRSLYIPKSEPDIVTDDLAFRNLRKDASKDKSMHTNFISTSGISIPKKKQRAVRSLSADLYGIIDKNSDNHTWYKEYVKLNRPSGIFKNDKCNDWVNNRDYDVDINGNRPKSMYQGRVQVCIPHEEERSETLEVKSNKRALSSCYEENITNEKSIQAFSDQELSEYQKLCRDLESLIKKTSEKVKSMETKSDTDSRNSLSEFVEWEKLLDQNDTRIEDKRTYEPSKLEEDEVQVIKGKDIEALSKEVLQEISKVEIQINNEFNHNDNDDNLSRTNTNLESDNFDKNIDRLSNLEISTDKNDLNNLKLKVEVSNRIEESVGSCNVTSTASVLADNEHNVSSSMNSEGRETTQ